MALRGSAGPTAATVWKWLGLLSLAKVIARSVITAPGPLNVLKTEVPNLVMDAVIEPVRA